LVTEQGFDYHHYLHKPDDQSVEFQSWATGILDAPGIPFDVPDIDEKVLPLRKGTETILLGRPGMGKTSMLLALAKAESARIMARDAWEHECVVYVSYEQTSEELSAILQTNLPLEPLVRGQVSREDIEQTAIPMVNRAIWIVGHGLNRVDLRAPRLTPEHVYRTIQVIREEYNREINLLCLDYLQITPIERARDRVQAVTEIPIRIKELAMRVGCPAVIAAQAGRQVDGYKWPIPTLADCQWGSSIEQTADLILALWRPYNTYGPDGEPVPVNGRNYSITDKLLVMRMLKQRFKAGRHDWALRFDPGTLELGIMASSEVAPEPAWGDERWN